MNGLGDSASLHTWFNLSNGTIGTTGSGVTAKIENVGNGWYRCTVSRARTGTVYNWVNLCDADNSANVTASGTSGVYIWGAQREVASFGSSYIPSTGGSSTTRSADVCQITGGDFSSIWNGTEGSVVLEYDRLAAITSGFSGGYPRYLTVDDGTLNNRMGLLGYTGSPSNEAFYAVTGGSSQGDTLIGASAAGGISQKIGFVYKANDAAASLNGASVVADTTFSVPTVTKMQIGYYDQSTSSPINGHIARLRYYPTRLTNAKLQELSA